MTPEPSLALVMRQDSGTGQLADLLHTIACRRDAIAEADLTLTALQNTLLKFERDHRCALHAEHHALGRVMVALQHIERWIMVLSVYTLRAHDHERLMDRLDAQRRCALRRLYQPDTSTSSPAQAAHAFERDDSPEAQERLKKAFRALARRFHPDLADNEADRANHGDRMAKINSLYDHGDVAQLEKMVHHTLHAPQQAQTTDPDADLKEGVGPDALRAAQDRLARFDAILESLNEELRALRISPTHALMDAMQPKGRRTTQAIWADLKVQMMNERARRIADLPRAMSALEACVEQFDPADTTATVFDPYVDQELARLSLEHLATLRPTRKVQNLTAELENIAEHQPAVGRLILLTHVAQLSQRPLPGLESYEAIAERLEAAGRFDTPPMECAEALIAADGLVEYGPRRTRDGRTHMGLMFRTSGIDQAVPLLLRQFTMRQLFRQVLLHLGRAMRCTPCARRVFLVPLFRLRGLDNLRALVCPHCGTTQSSYFLPKGRDIQTVLNAAYLELDLVHEYTCTLARTSIGLQLLPVEEATMTVGGLRSRLHTEVFARHKLPVLPRQLILTQDHAPLRDSWALTELPSRRLTVQLAPGTPLGEAAALETLRHRIRSRFKQAAPLPPG